MSSTSQVYLFLLSLVLNLFAATAYARPLDAIKKDGTLKVGLEPGFLPFEMKLPSGEWVGFDIDMMTAFAKTQNVKVEFIDTKWDGIIPALMANKFDLIVSGMTITEERKKAVTFSDPYFSAGLQVMLKTSSASKFKSVQDIDRSGIKVAVKQGTTGDIFAKNHLKQATIVKLESEADAANSVNLGKVDAFIYDKPFLTLYASLHQDQVTLLSGLLSEEHFGVASRPGDKDVIEAFNAFLKEWKEKGGYDAAISTHFVTMPWKSKIEKLW